MTAPVGTAPFSTTESKKSEETLKNIIASILLEDEFQDFKIEDGYSVNELYKDTIATNKNGEDSLTIPDAGLLKYRGKVVGLGDNKYQHSQKNACERINLYGLDAEMFGLSKKRVFVVLAGEGFVPHNEEGHVGNSTGKTIVRAKHFFTYLINPTKEETYIKYREYLRQIIKEEQ